MEKGLARRIPFFYGWVVIAVAFVTMGIGVNARTSFSLLFPPILDEFGWDRGTVSATFSIGFIMGALVTPLIGAMMDRSGPRVVLPLGAVLTSIGLIGATYSYQPWHFYITLGVLVVGGSIFMSYIGHTLFLPNWFSRKRGLALGLAFAGVGFGSVTLLPLMQHTIQTEGWRESCWIFVFILLFVVVPLNVIFQRHKPQDLGLLPDGDPTPESGGNGGGERPDGVVNRTWAETDWTLRLAMRTAPFWWLMVSFFCGLYVWYAVQVHQTRYLIDVGITPEAAAFALGLVGLMGVVGQIAVGHLSDRIGREWAWTIAVLGFLATYACLFVLRMWPSDWLMYLMVAAQGLVGYGAASVFGAIPADLFAGRRYGVIFGVIASVASVGAGIGPWVTGVLFDQYQNYDHAFILAIAICAVSIFSIWMAGPRRVRLVAGRIPKSS